MQLLAGTHIGNTCLIDNFSRSPDWGTSDHGIFALLRQASPGRYGRGRTTGWPEGAHDCDPHHSRALYVERGVEEDAG